jgi:hypothetical protein
MNPTLGKKALNILNINVLYVNLSQWLERKSFRLNSFGISLFISRLH